MGTDSLYYIIDYSGHYYRTDKSDQLVAVAGEQDATVFTFAQTNSRICVGKKASFYCMVPIEKTEEDMSTEVSGSNEIIPVHYPLKNGKKIMMMNTFHL